jgi:uncharacterized membrane protein
LFILNFERPPNLFYEGDPSMAWLSNSLAGKYVFTLLLAMVPVAELRAAIPFGVAQGLPVHHAVLLSIIGNLIPVPFIILFIRRIFTFLRQRSHHLDTLVTRLEARAHLKSATVNKYGFIGLCILVAIPLPGTGAWTGALVAALMDIRLKRAMPAVILGVCIASLIVASVTYGVASVF